MNEPSKHGFKHIFVFGFHGIISILEICFAPEWNLLQSLLYLFCFNDFQTSPQGIFFNEVITDLFLGFNLLGAHVFKYTQIHIYIYVCFTKFRASQKPGFNKTIPTIGINKKGGGRQELILW